MSHPWLLAEYKSFWTLNHLPHLHTGSNSDVTDQDVVF